MPLILLNVYFNNFYWFIQNAELKKNFNKSFLYNINLFRKVFKIMEWELIDQMEIEEFENEEQERRLFLNIQIDEHMQWEEDYELYINDSLEDTRLENLNTLINNYRNEGNCNNWNNWYEVYSTYKIEVLKILIYQIKNNLSPPIIELNNDKAYYNYLLFLANVLRNL